MALSGALLSSETDRERSDRNQVKNQQLILPSCVVALSYVGGDGERFKDRQRSFRSEHAIQSCSILADGSVDTTDKRDRLGSKTIVFTNLLA